MKVRVAKKRQIKIEEFKPAYKKLMELSLPKVRILKNKILNELNSYINSHRQRPDVRQNPDKDNFRRVSALNNLYESIAASSEVSVSSNGKGWSMKIGKKSFLDEHAPYWYIVNYGGRLVRNAVFFGYFDGGHRPSSRMRGEPFYKTEKGDKMPSSEKEVSLMIPRNPLPPMRYIESISQALVREVQNMNFSTKKKA